MKNIDKYGEWVVITGASSGIGREFAIRLSKAGKNIVVVARNAAALQRTVDEDLITETRIVVADVASQTGMETLFAETQDLDVGLFIHSAGIAHVGPFRDTPDDLDDGLIAIHITATVRLSRVFADRLVARGGGGMILISSIFGMFPVPYASVYGAAKSFMLFFGAALAVELSDRDVDVLTVVPGGTKTKMGERLGDMIDLTKMPMAMGDPAAVAREGLNALGHRDKVVPGFSNRLMVSMARLMPSALVKRQFGKMLKSALKPQSN